MPRRPTTCIILFVILALLAPGAALASPTREAARIPVVFIPGIMGSRLFNAPRGQEEEVWADVGKISDLFGRSPLMVLGLAPDGESPARDHPAFTTMHTQPGTPGLLTRLTGWGWGVFVDEDFYDTLVKHFVETHGYVENDDFWVYPYDWRKDLREGADGLDALIQSIQAQTEAAQVAIVAHSMGGVLTRQYISDPARAARVQQAVILGTPFLGTPKSFHVLQAGECMYEIDLILFSICIPEESTIKALSPNYPAFYEIMPSEAYYTVKGGGFYGLGRNVEVAGQCPIPTCLSYAGTYTTDRAPTLNAPLSEDARQFHVPLDGLTEWGGVPVTILGGANQQTIVGIREYKRWSWTEFAYVTVYEAVESPAGDGAVTQFSVSLENADLGVNLRGSASFASFETDHIGLVQDEAVLQYVDSLLGLSAVAAAPRLSSPEATGVQIIASGASAIHAYDALGRHTGPAQGSARHLVSDTAIPGSAYSQSRQMTSLALIGGREYTIMVESSGREPVDVMVTRSAGIRILSTHFYLGLDLPAPARLRFVGDPFAGDTWQLDADGRGATLQPVAPTSAFIGESVEDLPPAVAITLDGGRGPRGQFLSPVTVTLTASDNPGGAGIGRIEYAFSNDRQVRVYDGPFEVNPDAAGTLYALAVDRAGNQSLVSRWEISSANER